MYKLNKKGETLFFLMELLVISVVLIVFFGYVYTALTSEGKDMTLDVYDLGLLMERIPSIEGNFQHVFEFHNEVGVEFTENAIYLDSASVVNKKRYSVNYLNPTNFQIEDSFENVTALYFYKLGDELFVFIEPKPEMINLMLLKEENSQEYDLYFISEEPNAEINSQNIAFVLENDVKTQFSFSFIQKNSTGKALWYHLTDDVKGFKIYYNEVGRDFATKWYNKLVIFSSNSDLGPVEMVPLYWNSTLMSADFPVMVTKSEDFSGYVLGLRS